MSPSHIPLFPDCPRTGLAPSRPQLLGFDYLIDSSHHPWLLEVNGTPSLAVEHSDPAVEALIHDQKVCDFQDSWAGAPWSVCIGFAWRYVCYSCLPYSPTSWPHQVVKLPALPATSCPHDAH